MKEELKNYISQLEEILVEFNVDENSAINKLSSFKDALAKHKEDQETLLGICVYNVLATINSVPCQTRRSAQLTEAIIDAKEEMRTICEIL